MLNPCYLTKKFTYFKKSVFNKNYTNNNGLHIKNLFFDEISV